MAEPNVVDTHAAKVEPLRRIWQRDEGDELGNGSDSFDQPIDDQVA